MADMAIILNKTAFKLAKGDLKNAAENITSTGWVDPVLDTKTDAMKQYQTLFRQAVVLLIRYRNILLEDTERLEQIYQHFLEQDQRLQDSLTGTPSRSGRR
jgi:type VII secretion effector (TIGR04197 family)